MECIDEASCRSLKFRENIVDILNAFVLETCSAQGFTKIQVFVVYKEQPGLCKADMLVSTLLTSERSSATTIIRNPILYPSAPLWQSFRFRCPEVDFEKGYELPPSFPRRCASYLALKHGRIERSKKCIDLLPNKCYDPSNHLQLSSLLLRKN